MCMCSNTINARKLVMSVCREKVTSEKLLFTKNSSCAEECERCVNVSVSEEGSVDELNDHSSACGAVCDIVCVNEGGFYSIGRGNCAVID